MELWAHINGKDYAIANGVSLSDELGEGLDSGQISLPHVQELISVKPYDDVIIHDFRPNYNEDGTYLSSNLPDRPFHKVIDTTDKTSAFYDHFYRHMLAWTIGKSQVNLSDASSRIDEDGLSYDSLIYNYTISLISETKGLETVPMPNKSITQPKGTTEYGNSDIDVSYVDKMGYSVPFGVVSNYNNGLLLAQGNNIWNAGRTTYYRYVARLMANDNDTNTVDMCSFTSISESVQKETEITLPDWCVSSCTVMIYRQNYILGDSIHTNDEDFSYQVFHPHKYWVIRKRGSASDEWSRGDSYTHVLNYIKNSADDMDGELIAKFDSSDPSAMKKYSFSDEGIYDIFMYCDPKTDADLSKLGTTHANQNPNIFGMVDASNGLTAPTNSSYFISKWTISVEAESNLASSVTTLYEAAREAVELYSPYRKITRDGSTWEYERKYSLSANLISFEDYVAPETTINLPSLRDYLNQLFRSRDCLPVVHDGVIDAVSLSHRGGPFSDKNVNWVEGSLDGSSYSDRLVRNYNNALSKDNVVRCVERVGFRNNSTATMTLDNMRLELGVGIYKIDKIYMEYYKEASDSSDNKCAFLCRQDITPLVLLNSQRNLLSVDWEALSNVMEAPTTIENLAQYKFCTVGYDMGSKYITGWGTAYTYIAGLFFSKQKPYIQNIYEFVDSATPYGEDAASIYSNMSSQFLPVSSTMKTDENASADPMAYETATSNSVIKYISISDGDYWLNKTTEQLRSLMFLVEYRGFISTNVQASKDKHDGDVLTRDNASSSLSYLESDGINQKEKSNRLGNQTVVAHARIASEADLQGISFVWDSIERSGREKEHDDEIVYKRSIMIYKDYIDVTYYLCRNYVLRNYFTSVYSKERPFSLASYEESVERMENKNLQIVFSADASYYQSESMQISFDVASLRSLISFFKTSEYDENGKLNISFVDKSYLFVYKDPFGKKGYEGAFALDTQSYVSGNSLCFTIAMNDNVSAGVYISKWNPTFGDYLYSLIGNIFDQTGVTPKDLTSQQINAMNDVTGAKQTWYMFPSDGGRTGKSYSLGFGVGVSSEKFLSGGLVMKESGNSSYESMKQYYFDTARRLPFISGSIKEANGKYLRSSWNGDNYYTTEEENSSSSSTVVINEFASSIFKASETGSTSESDNVVFKDGKERITTTLQFEPISDTPNIMIGSYMMGLSDILGIREKNPTKVQFSEKMLFSAMIVNERTMYYGFYNTEYGSNTKIGGNFSCTPCIEIFISSNAMSYMSSKITNITVGKTFSWSGRDSMSMSITINSISGIYPIDGLSAMKASVTYNYSFGNTAKSGTMVSYMYMIKDGEVKGQPYISDNVEKTRLYSSDRYVPKPQIGSDYSGFTLVFDILSNPGRTGSGSTGDVNYDMFDYWGYSEFTNPSDILSDEFLYRGNYGIVDYEYSLYSNGGSSTTNIVNPPVYIYSSADDISIDGIPQKENSKNMIWGFYLPMSPETPYQTMPTTDNEVDMSSASSISITTTGNPRMIIKLPSGSMLSESSDPTSLRLYYLENKSYHFVFGVNLLPKNSKLSNGLLPESDGLTYTVYLSCLDSRSKTVWDANSGDPTYRIANYVKDTSKTYGVKNDCLVKKS